MSKSRIETPLARARGLGSAKGGTMHWWWLRVSAVALIPLSLWFIYSLIGVLLYGQQVGVYTWLQSPLCAALLALTLIAMFYHACLGMQEVIEDYIHHHGIKLALRLVNNFIFLAMGAISLLSIISLHLTPPTGM